MIFPINCGSVSSQQFSDALLRTVLAAQQFLFTARRDDCNEAAVAAIPVTDLLITSASLPVAIQRARNLAAPVFKRLHQSIRQGHDRGVEISQFTVEVLVVGVNAAAKSFIFHPITDVFPSELKMQGQKNQSNSELTASCR